jgi:hypothetical protein
MIQPTISLEMPVPSQETFTLFVYSLHISWTCIFREEQMFKASANKKQDSLAAAMLLPSQEKVRHICSTG